MFAVIISNSCAIEGTRPRCMIARPQHLEAKDKNEANNSEATERARDLAIWPRVNN